MLALQWCLALSLTLGFDGPSLSLAFVRVLVSRINFSSRSSPILFRHQSRASCLGQAPWPKEAFAWWQDDRVFKNTEWTITNEPQILGNHSMFFWRSGGSKEFGGSGVLGYN